MCSCCRQRVGSGGSHAPIIVPPCRRRCLAGFEASGWSRHPIRSPRRGIRRSRSSGPRRAAARTARSRGRRSCPRERRRSGRRVRPQGRESGLSRRPSVAGLVNDWPSWLEVELISDLADQLLEQVLKCYEPDGCAVFVSHQRHVATLLSHLREELRDPVASETRPRGRANCSSGTSGRSSVASRRSWA